MFCQTCPFVAGGKYPTVLITTPITGPRSNTKLHLRLPCRQLPVLLLTHVLIYLFHPNPELACLMSFSLRSNTPTNTLVSMSPLFLVPQNPLVFLRPDEPASRTQLWRLFGSVDRPRPCRLPPTPFGTTCLVVLSWARLVEGVVRFILYLVSDVPWLVSPRTVRAAPRPDLTLSFLVRFDSYFLNHCVIYVSRFFSLWNPTVLHSPFFKVHLKLPYS